VKDPRVIFELIYVIEQGVGIQTCGSDVGETVDISIRPEFVYEKFENRALACGAPPKKVGPDD
jgi:hypothetical protein